MAKNEGYKNRRNDLVFKTLVCVGPYDRRKGKERKGKKRKRHCHYKSVEMQGREK
jgi:hypothetical protein